MEKIRMMVTCCLLFVSGCASMQVIPTKNFSSLKPSLPKVLVVGEISLEKNVKLPQEEINKGKETLAQVFKEELPEHQILTSPPFQGDYLMVKTKITYIRKSNPLIVVILPLKAMSRCDGELSVFFVRQNQTPTEILKAKVPEGFPMVGGIAYGDYGAYYGFLKMATQKIVVELKKGS